MSPDTVGQYLEAFASAYLILPCPYFTYSERKSVVRSKKYYPIDLGMHDAVVTKGSLNIGKKFEAFVFYRLRKKFHRVFYWKEKGEIDFVVETQNGIQPVQVSFEEAKERHALAAIEFKKEHPHSLDAVYIHSRNFEAELEKLV